MSDKRLMRVAKRTEKELVLVHDVRNTEVDGSKDKYQRLYDTVQQRDDEDENSLRIDNSIIDHRRRIELGIV